MGLGLLSKGSPAPVTSLLCLCSVVPPEKQRWPRTERVLWNPKTQAGAPALCGPSRSPVLSDRRQQPPLPHQNP